MRRGVTGDTKLSQAQGLFISTEHLHALPKQLSASPKHVPATPEHLHSSPKHVDPTGSSEYLKDNGDEIVTGINSGVVVFVAGPRGNQ